MIYTERKVSIKNDIATIDSPIILFRGDREVEIMFTIVDSKFKFQSNKGNVIDKTQASFGQLAVALPDGTDLFTEIVECENGVVIFSITGEMIDEIHEVGFYSFHIRLYNDDKSSRITLPPVMEGIEIREPLIIEGDVENTDLVGDATVGYSMVQAVGTDEEVFDEDGNYIPTVWGIGDKITAEKLNKMEEGIERGVDDPYSDITIAIENKIQKNNLIENISIQSSNGTEVSLAGVSSTDYIEVEGGVYYHTEKRHTLAWYDVDKVFISGISSSSTTANVYAPDNAVYCRMAFDSTNLDTAILIEYDYMKYYEKSINTLIDPEYVYGIMTADNVDDMIYEKLEDLSLINPDILITGDALVINSKSVSGTDGTLIDYDGICSTDYINVLPNRVYYTNARTLAWYDADKRFLSGYSSATMPKKVISPFDAQYVVVSSWNTAKNNFFMSMNDVHKLPKRGDAINDIINPTDILCDSYSPIIENVSIESSNGTEVSFEGLSATDYIKVEHSTEYKVCNRHTIAWYDENGVFIEGVSSTTKQEVEYIISPDTAAYVRAAFDSALLNEFKIVKNGGVTVGTSLGVINSDFIDITSILSENAKYGVKFTTLRVPSKINDTSIRNLTLIAVNERSNDGVNEAIGYLYADYSDGKIYYSGTKWDNPEYLFTWKSELTTDTLDKYLASISMDGDVIFQRIYQRQNPIIYPAGDYENPVVVDFGEDLKPYGYLSSTSIVHMKDCFIFGEYTAHSLEHEQNNDPRIIWKVTKPYTNKDNWQIKHSFKHVFYSSPVSDQPDNEIGHIHTVVRDPYSDAIYCSTGDIDRHCRVWESIDNGDTWYEVASDGQKWRALGMIFTEDKVYWGTDSHYTQHMLMVSDRDTETGRPDFTTLTEICTLDYKVGDYKYEGTQPTYVNCLLREPYGLLFFDRAEPRTDYKIDIVFFSLEDYKLYKIGTFDRHTDTANEPDGRFGFSTLVATNYQPNDETGIILGGSNFVRPMSVDILNNNADNQIGVLKVEVFKKD